MKAALKILGILALGLGVGAIAFWGFTKTPLYEKLAGGRALIVQEALPILYVTDPQVGPMMLPHTKIHFRKPYLDSTVVTNAEGFTGRDYPLETDNYRIAILGDSAVEAYGVADTNRFPQLTESMVYNKTGGKLKVEVMGFGVSGWGTVHEYGAIRKYVLKYRPNEIWLMFLATNDTGDNTPLLSGPPNGPTFIYRSRDSDEIVDVQFGYPDIPPALEAERQRRYGAYLRDTWDKWNYQLMPYFWSPEHNPRWDLIMSHTLQTLGLVKRLCDANGIKLTLVYRPNPYDDDKEAFDHYRKEVAISLRRDLPMDQGLGAERFRKQVESMGIGYIRQTWDKGIATQPEESNVTKHFATADFLSDIIIKRMSAAR